MATEYNPRIVTDNLVLCLDAANTKSYTSSSATTWTDMSGSGNNATLSGATYNSDNSGNILFDGSNDYATFNPGSDIAFGTGTFAVEVWAKFDGEGPFYFIETRNSGQTTSRCALFVNVSEKIEWYTGSSSLFHTSGDMPTWSTGNVGWNHIVFSREGTGSNQFKAYINGEYKAAVTDTTNYSNSSTEASIGRRYSGSEFIDGKIPIVRIYKGKALTAAEVKQNFNAQKARYGL